VAKRGWSSTLRPQLQTGDRSAAIRHSRSRICSALYLPCLSDDEWLYDGAQPEQRALPHESLNAIRWRGTPAPRGSSAARVAANSSGLPRNAAFREVVDKPAPHNAAERVRLPVVMAPSSTNSEPVLRTAVPAGSLMGARIEGALERCVASTTTKRPGSGNVSSAWWSRLAREKAGCRLAGRNNRRTNPRQIECPAQGRE